MTIEEWIQYGSMVIAVAALIIKRKGMKKFIPVALFASFYANLWCFVAMNLHWWEFPSRILSKPEDVSLPANFVVVPIMAMFWVRYSPLSLREKVVFAFWSTNALTGFEFIIEKYTNVLEYYGGYDWYFSYILWFFSWFAWYGFDLWFNGRRRELDSLN